MKTHVNLFEQSLLPVAEQWSLPQLSLLLGGCAAVLLLLFGSISYQQQQVNSRLQQSQQQLTQQLQQQEQFQQLLQQRTASTELLAAQSALQARIQRTERIMQLLQQQQQLQVRFSEVLAHLEIADVPELWLSDFKLQQQRSSFTGYALRSAEVPGWLSRLAQHPYFKGQSFQRLKLEHTDDAGLLLFQVEAQPGSAL
ncbi:PilN domain-containing protein [Alkalimonas sp.]|uniref:PilN domain-containing protein n=1 Tax=Alkalimonas sp. TaxID=1872453 RepID=UPI00263A5CFA|nr:PilN domain-containing protein [Alkalimonas sp.]MCC5826052.1 PilN domain-containing protein [Alkalimonas sp.]